MSGPANCGGEYVLNVEEQKFSMFTYTGANEIDVLINCHSTCVPFYVVPSTTATGYITLST